MLALGEVGYNLSYSVRCLSSRATNLYRQRSFQATEAAYDFSGISEGNIFDFIHIMGVGIKNTTFYLVF